MKYHYRQCVYGVPLPPLGKVRSVTQVFILLPSEGRVIADVALGAPMSVGGARHCWSPLQVQAIPRLRQSKMQQMIVASVERLLLGLLGFTVWEWVQNFSLETRLQRKWPSSQKSRNSLSRCSRVKFPLVTAGIWLQVCGDAILGSLLLDFLFFFPFNFLLFLLRMKGQTGTVL